jgi:hypothetical protein
MLTPGNQKVGLLIGNIDNSNTNPLYDVTPSFSVQAAITRSTTVTAYTPGQLILGNAASILPTLDLSTATGLNLANRRIAITSAFITSDNGANSAFSGYIDLFNVNNPATTSSLADYITFNPTAAAMVANFVTTLDGISSTRKYGTTSNLSMQTEILRKCKLDAAGKLYFAPVNVLAYTPLTGEVITLILKFYLLN